MQGPGGPVEAALSRSLNGCRPQTLRYPGARLAALPPPRKTLTNLFQCERRPNRAGLLDHRHLLLASSGREVTIPSALRSVHALLPEGHDAADGSAGHAPCWLGSAPHLPERGRARRAPVAPRS